MAKKQHRKRNFQFKELLVVTLLGFSVLLTNSLHAQSQSRTKGVRKYELSNHLDNVLVTITDRKLPIDDNTDKITGWYEADVYTAQDYYAFGMIMPERAYSTQSFRFGFQGQEGDNEIKGNGNSWNYKYRMHDPRTARFFSVDPLAKEYPYYGTYSFSGNRVIDATELEGLEPNPLNYITQGFADLAQETGRLIDKAGGQIQTFFSFGTEKGGTNGPLNGAVSNETRATITVGTQMHDFFTPTSNNKPSVSSPFKLEVNITNENKVTVSGKVTIEGVDVHAKNVTSQNTQTGETKNETTITVGRDQTGVFIKTDNNGKTTGGIRTEQKVSAPSGFFIKLGGEISVGN